MPGVRTANVSLEQKTATVTYDPQRTTVDKLIDAVEQAGYGAAVKSG